MKKRVLVISLILAVSAWSQEVTITGFPVDVGESILQTNPDFFEPYYPKLQEIADTLEANPLAYVIVTGTADAKRYRENHDPKNAGVAVSRAAILREILVGVFRVDPAQIITQTDLEDRRGLPYRSVSARIDWNLADLNSRIDTLASRPAVTQVTINKIAEHMGMEIGAGIFSSPFSAVPIATGAVTWERRLFVQAVFGHTFWDSDYVFRDKNLKTRHRLLGGSVIVYPFENVPVGVQAGWIRVEEISQTFHDYVRMSEGPIIGMCFRPVEYLSLSGLYNSAKEKVSGRIEAKSKDYFLAYITIHKVFGGEK